MLPRELTRKIRIGPLSIGGQNRVLIQSMCSIKTSKIDEVVAQINRATLLGADLMRLSILDEEERQSHQRD
jgi:(E)-4-hydroxy-3-methylbut-2-enyl-diphosphate synthase